MVDIAGNQREAWKKCRDSLLLQIERHRIDHRKASQAEGRGPFKTFWFPDLFTDQALNFLLNCFRAEAAQGYRSNRVRIRLISVTHRASDIYDWGTSATFELDGLFS